MVVSQLAPETTREELAEYFAAHHATLVSLLPEDTTCKDLFEAVNLKRPIARFFAADDDPAIGRELERLEMKLVGWANEAAARSKKRAAPLRKKRRSRSRPRSRRRLPRKASSSSEPHGNRRSVPAATKLCDSERRHRVRLRERGSSRRQASESPQCGRCRTRGVWFWRRIPTCPPGGSAAGRHGIPTYLKGG